MEDFDLLLADFGQVEVFDEADDLTKGAINVSCITSDLRNSENGTLPEVLCIALCDRHIERIGDARFDLLEHATLSLERVIFGYEERELQNTDDHPEEGNARVIALRRLRALRRRRSTVARPFPTHRLRSRRLP